MYIIIKGNNSKPTTSKGRSSQGFTPHWNHAMDKNPVWCGTHSDYDRELKKRGLRVYDPEKPIEHKKKPEYKKSQWAIDMVKQISNDTDSKGRYRPSTTFVDELKKKGYGKSSKQVDNAKNIARTKDVSKGGIF